MSILFTLRKFIDPVGHRQQQEDLRRQREACPPDADPDEVDLVVPRERRESRAYRCRLCQQDGEDPRFCSFCLAETMEPITT
jgi:hypothetical protein